MLAFDFSRRDLSHLTDRHQPLLSAALDDLPLVNDHGRLGELVRAGGSNAFAFRIADDHRLLAIWQSCGTAAIVCTFWRRKLAHIDLLFANDLASLGQNALNDLPLSDRELASIEGNGRPLLAMVKVRRKTVGLAEIMGMIAYMPVWLDIYP
jgi:hypothetical protein